MMSVREVSAMCQIQPKNRVPGLQHGGVGLHVGLRSGMRLHIGVLRPKQLLGAITRQVLDDVRKLASAVIALTRISLAVLILKHRACPFAPAFADEVLPTN